MRVLVVEDEQKVASLIKSGLEQAGFDVVVTHDGDSAVRLATSAAFEAMVCLLYTSDAADE